MLITFEVVLDTKGDSINPEQWLRELKELLDEHYFVESIEVHDGKNESRKG